MFSKRLSSANNFSFKALSFFIFMLSSVLFSSSAQAIMIEEANITTLVTLNDTDRAHDSANFQHAVSSTYSTTNGNFNGFNQNPKLDNTIIFSLITTILLGFLALFGAIQLPKYKS